MKHYIFLLFILILGILSFSNVLATTVLDLQVQTSADDAFEGNGGGYFDITSTAFKVYSFNASGRISSGIRLQNVNIPKGAVIDAAYVSVFTSNPSYDDVDCTIYGDNVDDANDFLVQPVIETRSLTSANTGWITTTGTGWVNSPDIKNIIQEIVDRDFWVSGNDMAILFLHNGAEDILYFVGYSWDFSDHTYAPKLHIEYTLVGGPPERINGFPSGVLLPGTTQTNISLDTSEASTCKYATVAGVAYDAMPNTFTNTGDTSHSSLITDLINGTSYNFYVRCQNTASGIINADDFIISFSVDTSAEESVHLYWTPEELAVLKTRTGEQVYQNIKAWGDAHKNDAPPIYPASPLIADALAGQTSIIVADPSMFQISTYSLQAKPAIREYVRVVSINGNTLTIAAPLEHSYTLANSARLSYAWKESLDWMNRASLIERFLETMSLLYYITDDTSYADAAVNWMVSVANWPEWNWYFHRQWQVPSLLGTAYAVGYDSFKGYMSAVDRATVRDKIILEIGHHLYHDYTSGETVDGGAVGDMTAPYPNSRIVLAASLGLSALSLGPEAPSAWLAKAKTYSVQTFDMLDNDGTWFEGLNYATYGLDSLITFADVLRRMEGTNYFSAYSPKISGLPEFFAFMTYNDHFLQVEDSGWISSRLNMTSDMNSLLAFMYRVAKEYNNGYAQTFANTYVVQDIMQSFVWKNPSLPPLSFSGLGNFKYFDGIGFTVYRSDWTDTGLLIFTKGGTSRGHAHNSAGEFQIYYKGKPVTCDFGYALYTWYDESWTKNTIVEGLEFIGNTEINIPGYGQCQEPGDFGNCAEEYHGIVEAASANAYYAYSRINGTPAGKNPFTNDHTSSYVNFWTGNISTWLRQTVFLPGTNAFVVEDRVVSPASTRFSWLYHAMNAEANEVIDMTIDNDVVTVVKNGGTYDPVDVTSKIVMLEPVASNRTTIVKSEDPGGNKPWKYLVEYPTANSNSALFLNVIFPEANDYSNVTVARVFQGNLLGTIITNTANSNKDLVLFSSDGNLVNQYIELDGYYQAADGNNYTFNGTQIEVQFSTYKVIKLTPAGDSPSFSISSTNQLHLFQDKTNALQVIGTNFDLSTDFSVQFLQDSNLVSSFTLQPTDASTLNLSLTSTQVSALPAGFYDLKIVRIADSVSQTYAKQILITTLGDIWSSTATEVVEQKRDGKVDLYDVSRMLSKWGSTLADDLVEVDINAGPSNISLNKIDLFDANLLMRNWRP